MRSKLVAMITTIAICLASLCYMGFVIPGNDSIYFAQQPLKGSVYEDSEKLHSNFIIGRECSQASGVGDAYLQNLTVVDQGSSIEMSFLIDNKRHDFSGDLYPVVGGGYYDEKLVLGDFTENEDFNVAYFRVEKACTGSSLLVREADSELIGANVLILALEALNDGSIIVFQQQISDGEFHDFLDVALANYEQHNNSTQGSVPQVEVVSKTMALMQINTQFRHKKNVSYANAIVPHDVSFSYDSLNTQNTGSASSYSVLNTFFSEMDRSGSTGILVPPTSTMGRVLNQQGWRVYNNQNSAAPYFYVLFSTESMGSQLIQIILCTYSSAYNVNTGKADSHLEVRGSLLVEWDRSYNQDICRVIYYGSGPELKDVYLATTQLAGPTTFFRTSGVIFDLYNNRTPWLGFLISRIKNGNIIKQIWNILMVSPKTVSNWQSGYEATYDSQMQAGGLIKDICTRSGTSSLLIVGNYLDLSGEVSGSYSSHTCSFKFEAMRVI